MSVFTTVTSDQLQHWLKDFPLGELLTLQGIAAGITNTNYFVTTTQGRYVLTLFEKNTLDELPFFLDLMTHLAERGVLCPHPVARSDGGKLGLLNGKPAALVSCLAGRDVESATLGQCAAVGRALGQMHLAGQGFPASMVNPRGDAWRDATAAQVRSKLQTADQVLLDSVLSAMPSFADLPQGVIHADLFRDNVLFDGEQLGGIIDFYYACDDALLYDLAIAVNDWCVQPDGAPDLPRQAALLEAYRGVRTLTREECAAWPAMLRRAALRFWLSRLYDLHFPQSGELTHAKDPQHFRRILQVRMDGHTPLTA